MESILESPALMVMTNHLLQALKDRLSRRDYRIVRLSVVHDLSQRQIARRVKVGQSWVSKTLAKAKRIAKAIQASLALGAIGSSIAVAR